MGCVASKLEEMEAMAMCLGCTDLLVDMICHHYAIVEAHFAYAFSLCFVSAFFHCFFVSSSYATHDGPIIAGAYPFSPVQRWWRRYFSLDIFLDFFEIDSRLVLMLIWELIGRERWWWRWWSSGSGVRAELEGPYCDSCSNDGVEFGWWWCLFSFSIYWLSLSPQWRREVEKKGRR